MVQIAQFIINSWRKAFKEHHANRDLFSSMKCLEGIYEKARPTVKKVLVLISAETTNNSQRAVLSSLKRYVRWLNDKKVFALLHWLDNDLHRINKCYLPTLTVQQDVLYPTPADQFWSSQLPMNRFHSSDRK